MRGKTSGGTNPHQQNLGEKNLVSLCCFIRLFDNYFLLWFGFLNKFMLTLGRDDSTIPIGPPGGPKIMLAAPQKLWQN